MIDAQFLGHACLRFVGAHGALICDPWLATVPIYGNTAVKYPFLADERVADAMAVSHIYISHHHEDHFHVPSLDLYPRDTPILIPAFEYVRHARAASMRRTLEQLGFTHVEALESWQSITLDLGEPLRLTLIPSAQSRWHDWENSGLILECAGWTALNLNDNMVDDALLAQIKMRVGRPDAVFVQGFPSTEFPGSFDFSTAEKIGIGRQKRGNVDQADQVIRALAPRSVTPIACDIAWHRRQDLYRNYSDKPTPSRFGPLLERRGLLGETAYREMGPGDSLNLESLSVTRRYGSLDYAGFRRRLRRKMRRYEDLVDVYDTYSQRCDFDPSAVPAVLETLRAYFPVTFPIEAHVRLDFVITGTAPSAAAPVRIVFRVAGRDVSIAVDGPRGDDCDQEIIVPQAIWQECLEGSLLRRDLFNLCVNRQLKPFKPAVAALRYFINYYVDFGDISPWARVSSAGLRNMPAMRNLRDRWSPRFTAHELRDEYAHAN